MWKLYDIFTSGHVAIQSRRNPYTCRIRYKLSFAGFPDFIRDAWCGCDDEMIKKLAKNSINATTAFLDFTLQELQLFSNFSHLKFNINQSTSGDDRQSKRQYSGSSRHIDQPILCKLSAVRLFINEGGETWC
jgi:hypothetical protein